MNLSDQVKIVKSLNPKDPNDLNILIDLEKNSSYEDVRQAARKILNPKENAEDGLTLRRRRLKS